MLSTKEKQTNTRPTLDENISLDDYLNYYWLKKELVDFCRKIGINYDGWKLEIHERIVEYLSTKKVCGKKESTSRKVCDKPANLSLDTIVTENFKRNPQTTAFFRSIEPRFHYSVRLNKFIRENAGITYKDIIDEWRKEYEGKKSGTISTPKLPQCEYNRFIKEYLADNKGKSFKDAVSAWNVKKTMRGDNVYHREELSLYSKEVPETEIEGDL